MPAMHLSPCEKHRVCGRFPGHGALREPVLAAATVYDVLAFVRRLTFPKNGSLHAPYYFAGKTNVLLDKSPASSFSLTGPSFATVAARNSLGVRTG